MCTSGKVVNVNYSGYKETFGNMCIATRLSVGICLADIPG